MSESENFNNNLLNLEKRINVLKYKLRHDQLKHDVFHPKRSNHEMDLVLEVYENSIIKAADSVGVDKNRAINWYIGGLIGNPEFIRFYKQINEINLDNSNFEDGAKYYNLEATDSGWIYTALVNGEKISIISSDFERLTEKIKEKNLPF